MKEIRPTPHINQWPEIATDLRNQSPRRNRATSRTAEKSSHRKSIHQEIEENGGIMKENQHRKSTHQSLRNVRKPHKMSSQWNRNEIREIEIEMKWNERKINEIEASMKIENQKENQHRRKEKSGGPIKAKINENQNQSRQSKYQKNRRKATGIEMQKKRHAWQRRNNRSLSKNERNRLKIEMKRKSKPLWRKYVASIMKKIGAATISRNGGEKWRKWKYFGIENNRINVINET